MSAVLCTFILCNAMLRYKAMSRGNGITATGSASLDFEADLIVWRGKFQVNGDSLEEAYRKLHSDAELVRQYIKGEEIREDELVFGSIEIERKSIPVYDEFGNLTGHKDGAYRRGISQCERAD